MNYMSALANYSKKKVSLKPAAVKPFGIDAKRGPSWTTPTRKSVTVLVIGETARAVNFSLNGYARETNPRLAKLDGLINFPNVTSCGTDTAQSLPCMFSGAGRAKTSSDISRRREGLLDIIKRAGFPVLWRENQSGCKAVCARVATENLTTSKIPQFFHNSESSDAVLLHQLEDKIAAAGSDAVIVLHMMGSHGPAYYKRYPPEFEKFTPVCKSSQFSHCTGEEIVNAYDNTILYTDHVLGELAEKLKALDAAGQPASMIYLSDHGESLGEKNIYLHGMPYALAPQVQKHVPMVMWFSPLYQKTFGLDTACLAQRSKSEFSHDNFFHSVLGLLDIETKPYAPELDIFAPCRKQSAQAGAAP
jgi:lipid A ethanolaminephosphotransferase